MRGTLCSTDSGLWMTHRYIHSIHPWDPLSWQTGKRQSRYWAKMSKPVTLFHITIVINFAYMCKPFILFFVYKHLGSGKVLDSRVRSFMFNSGQIQCGFYTSDRGRTLWIRVGAYEWTNYASLTRHTCNKSQSVMQQYSVIINTVTLYEFLVSDT
jgi:hypothetical protein